MTDTRTSWTGSSAPFEAGLVPLLQLPPVKGTEQLIQGSFTSQISTLKRFSDADFLLL
jgi:hypothetical protein